MRLNDFITALLLACISSGVRAWSEPAAESKPAIEPFEFVSGKQRIAGEVHRLGALRCIAVIIVGGSNVRTRTDTAQAVPFFLNPATSVVLMDRRGNGRSTGTFEVPDTRNTRWQVPRFGHDVAAVARYLKINLGYRRVVLAGTSMGGWVNVAAAAQERRAIDAVVSINGGASTVGVSDEYDRLVTSGIKLEEAARRAQRYGGIQGYDPRSDLAKAQQPFLWVFGMKDASNPSMLDLAEVRRLAKRGKPFRWLLLPNTDHEFVDTTTHEFDSTWIKPVQEFISGGSIPACR